MLKQFHINLIRTPWLIIILTLGLTVYFAMQLKNLRWETDARVYMPPGHPAIIYDKKIEDVFGSKDPLIITIVNDEQSIFNPESLARIARITEKVAALPGVVANRLIDVASLSTASYFVGDEDAMGTRRLMPVVPATEADIAALRQRVFENADLFVGNLISQDGKAAMIRVKLKEGAAHRYQSFFAIKSIIAQETGDWSAMSWPGGGGGSWEQGKDSAWNSSPNNAPSDAASETGKSQGATSWPQKPESNPAAAASTTWPATAPSVSNSNAPAGGAQTWSGSTAWPNKDGASAAGTTAATQAPVKDKFYLAGRPVIEVTSGLEAKSDLNKMIPVLFAVVALMLFIVFRSWAGVVLPLFVMAASIIWTLGSMAALDVPLYTISTMLPVILVAVGIGDAIHLVSHYYDHVLADPHRDGKLIVRELVAELGAPLLTTSVTTAIGFLTLWFAEMPPFKVFGLFTMLGIFYAWLLSVTFIPAVLMKLRPRVSSYLERRKNQRVFGEESKWVRTLVIMGGAIIRKRIPVALAAAGIGVAGAVGALYLYVDSSWLSDFRSDSELAIANNLINDRFDGTLTLNVVIDGGKVDAIKSPALLAAVQDLQTYAEKLPYVGDTLSIVDYLKSMNKNLHAGNAEYDVLPSDGAQIGEYLFLFSVSGRPEELDEVVDFDYREANVSVQIRTDHTRELRAILDGLREFADQRFSSLGAQVNFAGSGNNSYVWADLLISSQTQSILLSKLGILLLATLMFRSLRLGLYVIVPVTFTTLVIAGICGALGIPLDVSTALAAGVAIGVGVDYAVHYIFRYLRERQAGVAHIDATQATLRAVGKTIVFSAAVVTAGFTVLLFSNFPPHVKLGVFVAAYMVISCVAALVMLPVMFSLVRNDAELFEMRRGT